MATAVRSVGSEGGTARGETSTLFNLPVILGATHKIIMLVKMHNQDLVMSTQSYLSTGPFRKSLIQLFERQ